MIVININFILSIKLHQIFFHQFMKIVLFRQITNFFDSRIREMSPGDGSYFYCYFIHRSFLDCKLKKSAYILLYMSILEYFKNIIWWEEWGNCMNWGWVYKSQFKLLDFISLFLTNQINLIIMSLYSDFNI